MYSFKQRHAIWQKVTSIGFLLPLFIFGVLLLVTVYTAGNQKASAATNATLNFQGRLLTTSGKAVPDGSYNLEFKLYNASAVDGGETLVQGACQTNPGPVADEDCLWVETRTGGNTVTVQNGYFSVALGSVNAFPSTINWDQELWLGMNVGGTSGPSWDGEMTPRFKLTAVPYAFRAGAVMNDAGTSAFTADDLTQIAPSSVQTANAAVAALRINQTGAGGLLQFQGNGADMFTVDKSGNAVLGGGLTLGNSSSTTAGTIRWNGTTFQGYNGSSWASLGSSAVMPFVSITKTANETENNVTNPTATLQPDNELSFAIGANETWNYSFHLQMTVNATPDVKFSVTAPTGATCVNSISDIENAISVANLGCGVSSGIIAVATGVDTYIMYGSITNGSTAGNVTLNWAQNTANAANTIVHAGSFVEASRSVGGSSADVAFIQNGNSFGGTAVLGTNDNNGLSFETNGTERMQILSTGEIRASGSLLGNRTATGTTGTTSGTGTNTTTLTLSADAFAVNDVIFIDNAGQDYYTRVTVDPGTGSYTVSPAVTFENARTVTKYTIQNVGATATDYTSQANRFFQGYFLGGIVVGAGSTTISDGLIERTTGDITLTPGTGGVVQVNGTINATTIIGDGAGLTNISGASVDGSTVTALNASNISSGTIADARLSTNVTLLGNTFNGASQLVQLDGSGALPAISGANLTSLSAANLTGALPAISGASLTSLNGSNISSGTIADARLSSNVTLLGNTFNGVNQLVQLGASGELPAVSAANLTSLTAANLTGALPAISGASLTSLTAANLTGALPAISGASLTSLNGSNISSGTVADARLSTNVTLLGNTFNGASQLVQLNAGGALPAISGANLTSLTAANLSGALPAISGASLTSLNGSNISSGTVADARLSSNVTLLGNTFNGINQLVQLNGSGALPAISGANLTSLTSANLTGALPAISGASLTSLTAANLTGALPAISGASLTSLNGSNISSGTVADARLTTNVTLLGNSFNGVNQLVQLNGTGALPALSGANLTSLTAANISGALPAISGASLTSLNGSNISSGTVADARLSTNVTLAGNTFNGINQLVQLNGSGALPAISGVNLTTLTAANLSGALPAISGASLTSLTAANLTGALPAISGANLTSLNGSNISSGTVADGRLSTNVALLNGNQTFSGTNTFTSGAVLGLSTVTSSAVASRAVSFPDEAGTVCLSNSNNCGYLRLASGSLQTDASNNDVLAVNKTSATGNLINLQRSGTAVFTVANSGALQIQSTSSTALDVRNGSGVSYFTVDANTGSVTIGAGTAAANGVLFVLDTRTADPTGVAGGSYYNSTDSKMRCYEGTIWTDCNTTNLLGETTLGVAGTTITVNLAASTEYLQCRVDAKGRTLASIVNVRFNADAGAASYGWNTYGIATTAVIDAQDSSDSELQLNGTTTGNVPFSADLRISNFADTRKTIEWTAIGAEPIGTDMNRYSGGGTWNNTASQISSVSFIASAGNFTAGSHAWCEGRNVR